MLRITRIIGIFCVCFVLFLALAGNSFAISGSQYVPSEIDNRDYSSGGENIDPSNYPNLTTEQIEKAVRDCEFKICDINKLLYEENKKAEQQKYNNSFLGRLTNFVNNTVNLIKTLVQKTIVVVKPFFIGLIRLDRSIFSFVSTSNQQAATNIPFPFNLIYKLLFGRENIQKPNNVAKVDLKQVSETKNGEVSKNEVIDNTRKDIEISGKKFEGWPISKERMSKSMISQYPDDVIVASTHLNHSSLDIRVDNETQIRATMDGTVSIMTDTVGEGLNTYPYRDQRQHKIVYYREDGTSYYKCEAGDKLSDYSVCDRRTYGIYAVLTNDKEPNEKYKTIFAHLSSSTFEHLLNKTSKRSNITFQVKKGDLIGYSDNAGYSSGPHLHYEVFLNEKSILASKGEFDKCLKETNQTIDNFKNTVKNNFCLESWYNYNRANLNLMGIDLSSINN